MLAGCWPAGSGSALRAARGEGGVLTGLLTEVLGGCSGDIPRDAARDVRGCSGVAHRFFTETLGGCSRDAQVTLLGMLGNAARVARGVLGATHRLAPGGVSRMPGGAGGPARRCPSGCAPRAPLRAPRRGWRSGGAGGRQRGGEGVVSPARLSRRPGSINEIIMQIEQPCATRQPYLIPAGGEAGRAGGSPGPSPRGAGNATPPGIPRLGTLLPPPGSPAPRRGTAEHGRWPVPGASRRLGTPRRARVPRGGPSPPARVGAGGQGCGWAGDGAREAPGERGGMGVARGGMGRGAMHSHTHMHTCEGPGILNCIADKSPT